MAAACHPKAQAKVQEELDLIIGRDRGVFKVSTAYVSLDYLTCFAAPTLADQNMLPQTNAFMLETYRWRPVSAGGGFPFLLHQLMTCV